LNKQPLSPSPDKNGKVRGLSRFRRGYIGHITSWRYLVTLVVLLAADLLLERTTVAQRATLGGFDTVSEHPELRPAQHTAVIGISAHEVEKYFGGHRPVPASVVLDVVTGLLKLKPSVLVVDVFTDAAAYRDLKSRDSLLYLEQQHLVWAEVLDTVSSEVLPILGGISDPPGNAGLASVLADDDRLIRRFRLRFLATPSGPGPDTLESLPFAAANAYVGAMKGAVKFAENLPRDTASIALRPYDREPAFFLLDDVLSEAASVASSPNNPFSDKVVVLGFVDGSDQVLTPRGVRTGPQVIADAIETVVDGRGAIRAFPRWREWVTKLALALLIALIHYKLPPRLAALSMIVMCVAVILGAFWIFEHTGYWTNFILIVVGLWIEQLYENVVPSHAESGARSSRYS
jgi:CHASE2 domain-containing sensor protein